MLLNNIQGDNYLEKYRTFRRGNASGSEIRRIGAYPDPVCVILPKAGYGIVKGNHAGVPYMLTVLATSLCSTHKHEDNLSFTLFFDGLEWLIDPSFYSHEYAAPIPSYLRSAAAHNSLFVPDASYSIHPGAASLGGHSDSNEFVLEGAHRCYQGILVKRELRGRLDHLELDVVDSAECNDGGKELYLMFHCGEGVKASLEGECLTLSHPDSKYQLILQLPTANCHVHYGAAVGNSIRGVTGHGFLQHVSINSVECRVPFNKKLNWHIGVKMT